MTVHKQENKVQYTGDGVTTLFPFTIPFVIPSDVIVFVNDVKLNSGFTVENRDSYENGSNIIFDTAPEASANIIITRDIPLTQIVQYPENNPFPSKVTEEAFDKLTLSMIDLTKSTIKVPLETPPGFNPVMPKPAPNRGVKYDATGNQLITTEYDPDEALGATKQYRDEAQAAANAAENSEANAKQSEITVTQKAQEVIQTANQALQDINTEETSAISNIQTTGGQYVQEAKDWAVKMDDKVDEVDFSAKYWAEKASAAVQQRVLNEMIISPVPLISAALHLTDGEKLVYGSNAQYIDYMIEYKKTYPEYFTTEEEWQRQVTTNGRCAKYVLDEAAKTIRLPKIIGYIEGTVTPSELGVFTPAGLPNITGTMVSDISEGVATGALKIDTIYSGAMWQGSVNVARMRNWSLDASLSNPIYGNSDTVQPYATKKLLYIVVGNVKVQSAASDVVDVTTTENDTVPLFTGQYFNFKPNNPSWLKAGEQQDSGGIYTSCYNKLVQALTDNIWEIKVIDSTAMEEGTDYSEYWIVYQDAMRFRTPLTACKEIMPGNEITSSLGFSSNPTNTVESYTVPYNGYITIIGYKTSTSNTLTVKLNGTIVSQTRALASGLSSESYFFARKGDIVTVSTDSTSTGWVIATQTITKATANGELYFKAASAVENIEILNVGQVMEELSNKVNVSNTSWAINACMPDYTAQTTFTLPDIGQTFTAPYDCLLFVSIFNAGAGNFELRYNNSNGGLIMFGSAGSNQVHVSQTAYLKKGWQIYRGGQIGYNQCYITPLIGAEGAN